MGTAQKGTRDPFNPLTAHPFPKSVDRSSVQSPREVGDANSGELLSRLRLAPCGLSSLPLVRFDIQLEGNRQVILHQRRERNDGVSGLAALISAQITLPEGQQQISDYHNLIYAAVATTGGKSKERGIQTT